MKTNAECKMQNAKSKTEDDDMKTNAECKMHSAKLKTTPSFCISGGGRLPDKPFIPGDDMKTNAECKMHSAKLKTTPSFCISHFAFGISGGRAVA